MKSNVSPAEKYEILTEINMIPLIDISLVLLIIFMVMTPFLMRSKIGVELPTAGSGETAAAAPKQLEIEIRANGDIFVAGVLTEVPNLDQAIRKAVEGGLSDGAVVEVDKGAAFQRFVTVMDAGRRVGVAKFDVAVRPERAAAPGR